MLLGDIRELKKLCLARSCFCNTNNPSIEASGSNRHTLAGWVRRELELFMFDVLSVSFLLEVRVLYKDRPYNQNKKMKWEETQISPKRLAGLAEQGVLVCVAPSPPQTVLQARLQPGLGPEIRLCLLHYAFAQGSLSGGAY